MFAEVMASQERGSSVLTAALQALLVSRFTVGIKYVFAQIRGDLSATK